MLQMLEGWSNDEYLVFFDASEISAASLRYSIQQWLPGHQVVGLKSWEDLIVQDGSGKLFSVPCVPLSSAHLSPFAKPPQLGALSPDARFTGKIKWYVQPLAFGGNPAAEANISWVSHEQHGQLVRWWNERYVQFKAQSVVA